MTAMDSDRLRRVRESNDRFRRRANDLSGLILSEGVWALSWDVRNMAVRKLAAYDAFDRHIDPYNVHDLGMFDLQGHRFLFRIDCHYANDSFISRSIESSLDEGRTLTLMLLREC